MKKASINYVEIEAKKKKTLKTTHLYSNGLNETFEKKSVYILK